MIIAEQKSLEEIKALLGDAEKVFVLGCGTCVTVCFAGGEREASIVASSLRMSTKLDKDAKDVNHHQPCQSYKAYPGYRGGGQTIPNSELSKP